MGSSVKLGGAWLVLICTISFVLRPLHSIRAKAKERTCARVHVAPLHLINHELIKIGSCAAFVLWKYGKLIVANPRFLLHIRVDADRFGSSLEHVRTQLRILVRDM